MRRHTRSVARGTPQNPQAGAFLARRSRAALCATTALQAAALLCVAHPVRAQPAPNARPAGGQVSSGVASIGGNATTTLIRQSSQNAVINWQSYNIGNAQTVQYAQPGTSSFTLNRVISANPSQIAGHILANGRIAIVNQSGVVFLQGSTVDTAGLVISAAGITDQDFMAGRLVFVQPPAPGAVVSNAGNITVRQAGLAALVAPQVANSGVITAALGRVVLGGATTHTLDLYGDGLVALNVTGQVTQVQLGGRTVPALVTNTGTILAPGGTVVLTAQAADGVVSKLISAGGTISAPTLGGQTGRVLVSGVGGDIEIDGAVQATSATGTGGSVTVAGNRNVLVASGGVLDASGAYGGGAVSVSAPTGNATIASGAVLRARGTVRGRGGRIAVQAGGVAAVHGTLDASGATLLDAGGTLSIGGAGLSVDGLLSADLAGQQGGSLALMPVGPVTVANTCGGLLSCISFKSFRSSGSSITDTDGSIEFLPNLGVLDDHAHTIVLTTNFSAPSHPLGTGDIIFGAGTTLTSGRFNINAAGSIDIFGTLVGPGSNPATSVSLSAGGAITEDMPGQPPSGTIDTSTLVILNSSRVTLDNSANSIGTLSGASASGTIAIADSSALTIASKAIVSGVGVTLDTGSLALSLLSGAKVNAKSGDFHATGDVSEAARALISATGSANIDRTLTQTGGTLSAGTISIGNALAHGNTLVALMQSANASLISTGTPTGTLMVNGAISQTASMLSATGSIVASSLTQTSSAAHSGSTISLGSGGTITLSGDLTQDSFSTITASGGTLALTSTSGNLILAGLVTDSTGMVTLSTPHGGITQTSSGSATATGALNATSLSASAGTMGGSAEAILLDGSANQIGTITQAIATGAVAITDGSAQPTLTIAVGSLVQSGTGFDVTLDAGLVHLMDRAMIIAGADFIATGSVTEDAGAGITATGNAFIGDALGQTGASLTATGDVTVGTFYGPGGTSLTLLSQTGNSLLHAGADATVLGSAMQASSSLSAGGAVSIASSLSQSATSTVSGTSVVIGAQIAGTLSQGGTGANIIVATSGDVLAMLSGDLTQDRMSSISAVQGNVTLTSGGVLYLGGIITASNTGTVDLTANSGLITETAQGGPSSTGSILGGTLIASALNGIDLSTASGSGVGNQIATLGSASTTTEIFLLADGADLTVQGLLTAPNAYLRTPTLTVAGAIDIEADGLLSIGADTIRVTGTVSDQGGLVAIGLLGEPNTQNPGTFSVMSGGTIDPASLGQISTGSAGTIALGTTNGVAANNGSLTNTTWTAKTAGLVSQLSIEAPLNLSANTGTLGLFSNGDVDTGSNAITVSTLYGAAATSFVAGSPSNAISFIASQGLTATRGSLVLADAGALEILSSGTLSGSAGVILTVGGTLQQDSDGSIKSTSGDVSLTVGGTLQQDSDSSIISTSGDVSLTSIAGALLLGGLVQSGSGSGLDGSLTLTAPQGTVIQAMALGGSPTGTILAGTLTAQVGTLTGMAYDLLLDAATNRIGTVASAFASGQIALDDKISLVEAASNALGIGTITASSIMITLTMPSLTFTQGSGASLTSNAGTVMIDAAAMVQDSGASATAQAGFLLTGNLTQQANDSIQATTQDLSINGDAMQSSSSLAALYGSILIGGNLAQTGSTANASGDVQIGLSLAQTKSAVQAGNDVLVGTAGPAGVAQTNSSVTGTHGVILTLSSGVSQDAASSIASPNGNISIQTTGGALALGGTLFAGGTLGTNGLIDLVDDAGNITQAASGTLQTGTLQTGTIQAASLGVQAGTLGGASYTVLLGGQNRFGTLVGAPGGAAPIGPISFATGDMTLDDLSALTLAANTTLSAGGNLAIALAAPSSFTQGSLSTIRAGGLATLTAASVEQQTGATLAAVGVSITADQVQQDGQDSVSATAGSLAISGSVTQTDSVMIALGDASVGGTLGQSGSAFTAGGAAIVSGSVGQDTSTLTGASVAIGQTGLAGTLSQIASSISSSAGPLAVTLSGDLSQDAQSTLASPAGGISLASTGGMLALGGLVSAPSGLVVLTATQGDIDQTAPGAPSPTGTLLALTLAAQAGGPGTIGNLTLDGAAGANRIGTVTQASATGTLLLDDGETLTVAGPGVIAGTGGVTLGAPGIAQSTGSTIVSSQGGVTLHTPLLTQANGATLTAATFFALDHSLVQDGADTVSTASGDITIGGNLDQAGGSALIATLGAVSIGGVLSQEASLLQAGGAVHVAGNANQSSVSTLLAGGALTIDGALQQTSSMAHAASAQVGDTTQLVSSLDADGDVTINGSLTQMQSGVFGNGNVSVAGPVTQAEGLAGLMPQGSSLAAGGNVSIAGAISQVSSTISAGGVVSQTGSTLTQTSTSSLTGATGVLLTLSGDLNQEQSSSIASSAGDIFIKVTDGDLNFSGLIAGSPQGQVALSSTEVINGTTGTVQAATLAASAGGDIVLNGAANRIAVVGPISVAGGQTLTGLSAGGSISLEDGNALLLDGVITGKGAVAMMLANDLTESAAGTITGDTIAISNRNTLSSPGTFSFAGLLAAQQIVLGTFPATGAIKPPPGTVEPAMIVWNGGTVMTGTAIKAGPGEPNIPAPISPASSQGSLGLFATAANFSQTGTTVIGIGRSTETVELSLTGPGGLIAFDPAGGAGLVAPGAQLLLDLQASGRATGNIDVAGLNIYTGTNSPTGGASLTGLVDGRGGSAAAATGFVHLLKNIHYEDNGCPVQSLNCVLLSPIVVPLGSPVQNLEVAVAHDQDEDDDLILPNVAEQDY